MITGIVDDNRGLLVRAQVSDGGRPYHEIEFSIAPSTTVGLALPRRYITRLGLAHIGNTDWPLGGIVQQAAPYYIAYVEWVHGLTPVIVVETPGEPLIGQGCCGAAFCGRILGTGAKLQCIGLTNRVSRAALRLATASLKHVGQGCTTRREAADDGKV